MARFGGRTKGKFLFAVRFLAVLSACAFICVLGAAFVAFASTSIGAYKNDTARLTAFMSAYLADDWSLSGENTNNLIAWVIKYSLDNDADPLLQMARILKESSGRHYKLNSRGERQVIRGGGGTVGFSQIHPFWIGKTVGGVTVTEDMLLDPEGNVRVGILLYRRYDNGIHLDALTHYNNPSAQSPSVYATDIERIYTFMLAKYRSYKKNHSTVDDAIGTAIIVS